MLHISVDVVIPAHNEERNIAMCLASVARQTKRPNRIILIDDGSTDHTYDYAKKFCELNGIELIAIQRKTSIGKTPTVKRQCREFDSDVEFILDGDTILESENYIERAVEELYESDDIASVSGAIYPIRIKDRQALLKTPPLEKFHAAVPEASFDISVGGIHRVARGLTNLYRDCLYTYLERFIYRGQMNIFASITNPIGCGVAYRRDYLRELFDHYESTLGDDLTNSEDIFIGFAVLEKGYRNVQIADICMRSREPEIQRLPRQFYLWSSSFLQCCYYFNDLLLTPFKFWHRREFKNDNTNSDQKIFEREYAQKYGRPIGWTLFMSAIEKVAFPTILLILIIFGLWKFLGMTIAAESILAVIVLTIVVKKNRFGYFVKGILVTPIRYAILLFDLITIGRFAKELWISKNKKWRK